MSIILLRLSLLACCSCLVFKGFRYHDNLGEHAWQENNGVALVEINDFLPPAISFCMKGKFLFSRHVDVLSWLTVILNNQEEKENPIPGVFLLRVGSKDNWRVYSWGQTLENAMKKVTMNNKFTPKHPFPRRNTLRKWIHVCAIADFVNDRTVLFVNGEKRADAAFPLSTMLPDNYYSVEHRLNKSVPKGYHFILGRYEYDKNPIIGYLVDLNVWDRPLSEAEMVSFSNCRQVKKIQGNLVNMDSSKFNVTGNTVEVIEVDGKEVDCSNPYKNILLPIRSDTYNATEKQCNKLMKNSIGPYLPSEEDYEKIHGYVKKLPSNGYKKHCWHLGRIMVHLPYRKTAGNSDWLHYYDGTPFFNSNDKKKRPEATIEKESKCLRWYAGPLAEKNNQLFTKPCDEIMTDKWSPCSACTIPHSLQENLVLTLSGLCGRSDFDTYYQIDMDETGLVTYHGFTSSIIHYDTKNRQWKLSLVNNKATFAISNVEISTLVLGNHVWRITNDFGCFSGGTEERTLTFSSCTNSQYTCNDGECIDLKFRCDGKVQCDDLSDEISCYIIEESQSYRKDLPPDPEEGKDIFPIETSIEVINLGQINEISSFVDFQYIIHMLWYENRLRYQNLKATSFTKLRFEEMKLLWWPRIVFYNTEVRQKNILDEDADLKVQRIGNHQDLKNRRIYMGNENPLTLSRFHKTTFLCNFDMAWYPFDTQTCSMIFKVEESLKDLIDLEVGNLTYSGPLDLTQYFVRRRNFFKDRNSNTLNVEISLGRRLLSIILTIFIPTVILNLVGHASNYFKEFFFEAVISLNVTVMLVLTTMFISVSNNLPKTAYIKMIDVWLLFNLVKPFNDILVTTYMDFLKTDDEREVNHHGTTRQVGETHQSTVTHVNTLDLIDINEKKQQKALKAYYEALREEKNRKEQKVKKLKRFTLVVNPMICIAFVIIYWIVGLNHYYQQQE